MSKISRNIFVGGMDTDSSPEIIDNKSYRMARNVISNTLTNDGVLHNMEGSLAKAAVNANWRDGGGSNVGGDWICTGLFTSNDESKIYMFLYATTTAPVVPPNYLDRNMLYEYDIATDDWDLVLAGVDANINWSGDVLDANVVSFRDQDFLFWLNYDGVPYKVEISEAVRFTVELSQGDSYTDNEFNSITSVIQAPPLYPPTIEYIAESLADNSNPAIVGVYTFKYRYIYSNGGISAFSPVSNIFYDQIVAQSSETSDQVFYNAINVDYEETFDNIESIEFSYKDATTWYLMSPVAAQGVGSYTFKFKSNTLKTALADTPLETKYYDNVPLTAITQEFIKNKIAYGNYLDKYDSVTDLSLYVLPRYSSKDSGIATIPYTQPSNKFVIAKTAIEAVAEVGDIIFFNIKEITAYGGDVITWIYNGSIIITDMNTILADIASAVSSNSLVSTDQPTTGYNAAATGTSTATEVLLGLGALVYPSTTLDIPLLHNGGSTITIGAGSGTSTTSFKSGANHTLGVVYYDGFNRQNDVGISEYSTAYVKSLMNRGEQFDYDGAASLVWNIDSTPPDWATHYQIVYSKNLDTNKFDTYLCDKMSIEYVDITPTTTEKRGVLRLDSLKVFQETNGDTPLEYIYQSGDKLIVRSTYNSTTGLLVSDATEPVIVTIKGTDVDENGVQLIYISPQSYDVLSTYLSSQTVINPYGWRFSMEIRNNVSNAVDNLFYEISEVYDIGEQGEVTRYHKGELRDQNEDLSGVKSQQFERIGDNKYNAVQTAVQYTGWENGDLFRIWQDPQQNPIVYIYGQVLQTSGGTVIFIKTFNEEAFDLILTDTFMERIDSATGIVEHGDSYIRERTFEPLWAGTEDTAVSTIVLADTPLASDFVSIFNDGFGRSQIIKQDKTGVQRDASIIISQSINEDFNFFGTTSFPNNDTDNFIDLDNSFGQIDEMINLNDNLYVIQDHRIGIQQVQKNVVSTADGSGLISAVSNIFGEWIPVADGIGTRGKRGYTQKFKGSLYMLDYEGKAAYVVGGREIKDITSKTFHSKMVDDSFVASAKSGIIPSRNEYVVKLEDGWYSFGSENGQWVTAFDFSASQFVHANGKYYTTNFNKLIEHENSTAPYNSFYTDEGFAEVLPSTVTIIANDKKFLNKSYESFALSGVGIESARVLDISTNISTTADIETLDKQEGIFYKDIGGGSSKDSTIVGKPLGIGDPDAVLNSGVDDSLRFPFIIPPYVSTGDNIYQDQGGTIVSLGLVVSIGTSNTIIQLDNAGTAIVSNPVFITKPSEKDGEDIKGQYIECTVEFGTDDKPQYISALDFEGASSELTH